MPDVQIDPIEAVAARYPRAAQVVRQMYATSARLLIGQVETLIDRRADAFWAEAERLIGLADAVGGSPLEALLEYTVAYLKEQARYLATREYSHSDFETVRREVYDNSEVMERFYLQGLMLTHAFWPIHFDIHEFFRRQFLPLVPPEGLGAEIGYGHGLYLLDVLAARPGATTRSYDISRCSQNYARRLLRAGGIAESRFDLEIGDVREPLPLDDQSCDWLIFAEVLEHIPDPGFALRELRRCLKPGRPLFATTVIDSNALDHLYQFEDVPAVRALLNDTGFEIVADKTLAVRDYDEKARDPSIDVVFVCIPEDR
jgi:ubiquinone/menaquinone biosynthesis C-methylase UbiE